MDWTTTADSLLCQLRSFRGARGSIPRSFTRAPVADQTEIHYFGVTVETKTQKPIGYTPRIQVDWHMRCKINSFLRKFRPE